MNYQVKILEQAEQDLFDIYYYIAYHDDKEKALNLLNKLEESCLSLDNMPQRGVIPQELSKIGVLDYLQIICFNYRILYLIDNDQVFIYAVLDGRRDMQQLLEQRLLRHD